MIRSPRKPGTSSRGSSRKRLHPGSPIPTRVLCHAPAFRAALLAAFAFLLTAVLPGYGAATQLRSGFRLQGSAGRDDNVLEALEADGRKADSFVRFLADAHLAASGLPFGCSGELAVRGLGERYESFSRERRFQGEGMARLDLPGLSSAARTRLEGGWGGRTYPDSTARNYHRGWGRIATGFRFGPRGMLLPRLELWRLDFRKTPRPDQGGAGFDLTYELPVRSGLMVDGGLELGSTGFGIASIRMEQGDPGTPPVPQLGPDRHDSYRLFHVSLKVVRRGLARIQYGYRSQRSNSVDAAFGRHEFRWLLSYPVPAGILAQFYGNLEGTHYSDPNLSRILVLGSGEAEARDDDNTAAVRLTRAIGRGLSVDVRHTWFRNESLLIRNYYRKRVWSAGLSWEAGSPSGF